MNALFGVDKPIGISSNSFLMRLKRKYGWKKCGYSGTLDPFASGLLIVGVGAYTRLFPYLDKSRKSYQATLWLGAKSQSLDIEQIDKIEDVQEFSKERILEVLETLKGNVSYIPPKFSAKHINGIRAYKLAREGVEFEIKQSKMEVFDLKLLAYCHPFVSFFVSVSEGGYVRSLGEIIANALGCSGSLSYLRRVQEGPIELKDSIKKLDALEALKLPKLTLEGFQDTIFYGKKFCLPDEFLIQKHQPYLILFKDFFSIIEFNEKKEAQYLLNRMPRC